MNPTLATNIEVDRRNNAISMTRIFEAPRACIFAAWTEPEQISLWWDPTGVRLSACEVDLRPGGRFRFVSQSAHAQEFSGVYREIAPPERLVFEAMNSTGTVLIEERAKLSRLTVTIKCGSPEQLEQFLKMGVDVGTSRTLDNLVAHIARAR